MRTFLSVVAVLALAISVLGQKFAPNVVTAPPRSPDDERKAFRLPPGFEAQLVAADPDIQKPMNLAFDHQGRLWVTDTIEYPWPVKPGEKGRDTVKVLEDFGPDGKARKITTFADGLNIPIGLLPLPGSPPSAMVYTIPHVLRITDGGKREPLYGTYGFRDTHGMTSAFTHSFDGWVYACHGFANDSALKGKAGQPVRMNSGNTYRMRPDGSALEQHTWGQVNPFGLALDPLGNLFSADCHSQPIYQLLRGGFYPSFGKAHDGLGFAPAMITGFKGSTAIAGIECYAADNFPKDYQGSFYVGDVMTNQLIRFELTYDGTTPRAKVVPFLDSDDQWFRPVDVKLGPDGALYIADFYNSIIGHYEVPLTHPARDRKRGRIWRIVYTGKDHKGTPAPRADFGKATVEELLGDLSHPNLTVRLMATNQLAHRGTDAVKAAPAKALEEAAQRNAFSAAHLLWVRHRLGLLAPEHLRAAATHREEIVRVHACRVLSEIGEWKNDEAKLATAALEDASPNVRRAAADALGRHPAPAHLAPLLKLRKAVPATDTHLMHVVRMALRNQLKQADAWDHVKEEARLIADVATGVPTPEAAAWLVKHIGAEKSSLGELEQFVHHAARHGGSETLGKLASLCAESESKNLPHQAALVRAATRGVQERGIVMGGNLKKWADGVADRLLDSTNAGERNLGADLIGQARLTAHQPRLATLATGKETPDHLRLAAMRSLVALDGVRNAGPLGAILMDATLPVPAREEAATLLARVNQPATREKLAAALPATEARLQTSIAARLALSREGGELLLRAVESGKASARLLQERSVTTQLEARGIPDLAARLKKLTAGLPPADAKLAALLKARSAGFRAAKPDVKQGAAVFEKHCAACHQIGGKGAKVGPQLDGIGLRGLERLLEDTLDPNRNVDQAFRTTHLRTKKGQLVQGLLLRQDGAVLVLADSQGKEQRVNEADVEERTVSNLSAMPANVTELVPEADFYHLMAYLLAQRPGGR